MNRKKFITTAGQLGLAIFLPTSTWATDQQSEQLLFDDDGKIPNSKYPLLLYKNAFKERSNSGASWLEKKFAENNWTNSWRNGIYSFHHYHSTSHEVLGVYSGSALVHLGGEQGEKVNVEAGDIIIIPAGVGHKNLGGKNLGVVGAYPDGRSWDIKKGLPGERPKADENIAALPIPSADPLLGATDGLRKIWV
ncbi:cupin domain-containing protein [Aurantibacter crassamenti]|uniref:cupin domain-containing protein n=1 Tax=Aurantibacter crassamenti TaxID=1837375 RepID=UPI001939E205|nr:cupin domain-containing protein [Aurantibacter crassamenti]MBM1105866.1 cupin domain-containing protein [Aurantibacter crassamenti]